MPAPHFLKWVLHPPSSWLDPLPGRRAYLRIVNVPRAATHTHFASQ
jgi:hypothetical protein